MNKWQPLIHNCDFILVRKEISDAFELWQREAATQGGTYYMDPDLAKIWKAFAAIPCAETAAELLEISPELAPYFEACRPGGVYYEAAALENGETDHQGKNASYKKSKGTVMRILDLILRRPSPLTKKEWGAVALGISVGFESSRKELYEACVAFYEGKGPLSGAVFSDSVQGLRIKAFQLYLASYLIAKRKCIRVEYGKQFSDLLWAQVFGNQMLEGIEQAKEFVPESGSFLGALPRIYKFFCLVACDVTGRLNPAEGMALLDQLGAEFAADCFRIIATAFKDSDVEQLVQYEKSLIEGIVEEIRERFLKDIKKTPQ